MTKSLRIDAEAEDEISHAIDRSSASVKVWAPSSGRRSKRRCGVREHERKREAIKPDRSDRHGSSCRLHDATRKLTPCA
jgi:hypothetical protein